MLFSLKMIYNWNPSSSTKCFCADPESWCGLASLIFIFTDPIIKIIHDFLIIPTTPSLCIGQNRALYEMKAVRKCSTPSLSSSILPVIFGYQ